MLFNDVPWRVERLDYYTDLVNPDLEGGTFTLPVREWTGLHSRPAAEDEAWFPTKKGDWVRFEDGAIARVVSQTPEMVRLELLGGALVTYATAAFVELAPVNLSAGYRVEVEFGVDYQHQAISTDELPRKLQAFVEEGLLRKLRRDELKNVEVEFLRAGESSLNYEVEADVAGTAAHRAEEIERELARLLVAACNEYGWTIPIPQLMMHRAL